MWTKWGSNPKPVKQKPVILAIAILFVLFLYKSAEVTTLPDGKYEHKPTVVVTVLIANATQDVFYRKML